MTGRLGESQEEEYVIYKMVSPMEIVQRTFSPVKGRMVEPVYLPRAVTLLPDRKYMFSFGITTVRLPPSLTCQITANKLPRPKTRISWQG